jgi:hypothetical protein
VPAPDDVPDPLTVIHDCVVVATQLQPAVVLTLIVPEPPSPVRVRLAGVSV